MTPLGHLTFMGTLLLTRDIAYSYIDRFENVIVNDNSCLTLNEGFGWDMNARLLKPISTGN